MLQCLNVVDHAARARSSCRASRWTRIVASEARLAEVLLAILPLVSRAQAWQLAADRVWAPIDRLRNVSVRLVARRGLELLASAETAKTRQRSGRARRIKYLAFTNQ
jgi:hypothetical protein